MLTLFRFFACLFAWVTSLKIPAWSNRRNLVQENSVQIFMASYQWDLDETTVNLFTVTPGKLSWPFLLSWHVGRGPEAGKQNMKCFCILKNSTSSTLSVCKRICKGSKFFWKRGEWESVPLLTSNPMLVEENLLSRGRLTPHPTLKLWKRWGGGAVPLRG